LSISFKNLFGVDAVGLLWMGSTSLFLLVEGDTNPFDRTIYVDRKIVWI